MYIFLSTKYYIIIILSSNKKKTKILSNYEVIPLTAASLFHLEQSPNHQPPTANGQKTYLTSQKTKV